MSDPAYPEPTNTELWAQPPTNAEASPVPNDVADALLLLDTRLAAGDISVGDYQARRSTLLNRADLPVPLSQSSLPIPRQRPDRSTFVLAIITLALSIPLTAVSLSMAGLPGLLIVWTGIVLVNMLFGFGHRQ